MKIESRGKYAGIKVHLDAEEATQFLAWADQEGTIKDLKKVSVETVKVPVLFAIKLGGKIAKLLKDDPKVLEDRTPEQIAASMQKDLDKIIAQQHAMSSGKDWKKVKGI